MTTLQIAALYIALNMILAPILMFRVGGQRVSKKIDLGDGGDPTLFARIRAHANFTENAPLALLGLLALAMMPGVNPLWLHIFGAGFFIGRIIHAMGMALIFGQGRFIGTLLTLLTYFGQAGYILYLIFTFSAA